MAAEYRTITDQIASGKALQITDKELRYHQLLKIGDDGYIINTSSVLSKYMDVMKKYIQKYKLTGKDAIVYQYRPTKLSYALYGTIELAPFILQINHMISAAEFTNLERGIYLFNSNIRDFLNEILIKEERDIDANRTTIKEELAAE